MGMETLKFFRLLVPGILIFLVIILVLQDDFHELSYLTRVFSHIQLKDTPYAVVFVVIGTLYYIFHIRYILWKRYLDRVQNNIKDRLISPFLQELNTRKITELKEGGKLMNVFYHFIDSDGSLIEKAKRVRFNGLIWTSTIDLTIISILGSLIFWIRFFLEKTQYNLVMACSLLVLALISFGLIQLTTRRHLSLSNEQLDVICQFYKEKLHGKINELLPTNPTT